jgi:hypothetical protein
MRLFSLTAAALILASLTSCSRHVQRAYERTTVETEVSTSSEASVSTEALSEAVRMDSVALKSGTLEIELTVDSSGRVNIPGVGIVAAQPGTTFKVKVGSTDSTAVRRSAEVSETRRDSTGKSDLRSQTATDAVIKTLDKVSTSGPPSWLWWVVALIGGVVAGLMARRKGK